MPPQVDDDVRREIAFLRALDYDKQEIAEQVDLSRNTVRKHLTDLREEIESSDAPKVRLATIILREEELLAYLKEQATDTIL